eukprot:scaffold291256_cov41-Tisochrysis_lutea.AAC.1
MKEFARLSNEPLLPRSLVVAQKALSYNRLVRDGSKLWTDGRVMGGWRSRARPTLVWVAKRGAAAVGTSPNE